MIIELLQFITGQGESGIIDLLIPVIFLLVYGLAAYFKKKSQTLSDVEQDEDQNAEVERQMRLAEEKRRQRQQAAHQQHRRQQGGQTSQPAKAAGLSRLDQATRKRFDKWQQAQKAEAEKIKQYYEQKKQEIARQREKANRERQRALELERQKQLQIQRHTAQTAPRAETTQPVRQHRSRPKPAQVTNRGRGTSAVKTAPISVDTIKGTQIGQKGEKAGIGPASSKVYGGFSLDFSNQGLKRAIVMSEILGKPVSIRKNNQNWY